MADGKYMYVAGQHYSANPSYDSGGFVYKSQDFGKTFSFDNSFTLSREWSTIALSRDGKTGIACVYNGQCWTTFNYGGFWQEKNTGLKPWTSAAVSGK